MALPDSAATIQFDNGRRAHLVKAPLDADPKELVDLLGLTRPGAILVLSGGAGLFDEALAPRLQQLCSRGLARAAAEAEALIIDGGTQSGAMQLMGQGVADRGYATPQLGVAPADLVTYPGGPELADPDNGVRLDANHSHFVLVDSDRWGGETDAFIALAQAWAGVPVVTLLANGGAIAKDEILRSVRLGWPVLVLEGSGRLADELVQLHQESPGSIEDPVVAEIVAEGDLHFFAAEGGPDELREKMRALYQGDGQTLPGPGRPLPCTTPMPCASKPI